MIRLSKPTRNQEYVYVRSHRITGCCVDKFIQPPPATYHQYVSGNIIEVLSDTPRGGGRTITAIILFLSTCPVPNNQLSRETRVKSSFLWSGVRPVGEVSQAISTFRLYLRLHWMFLITSIGSSELSNQIFWPIIFAYENKAIEVRISSWISFDHSRRD